MGEIEPASPVEHAQFSPDVLPHEERFNIGGLFASLVQPEGPHRRRGLKALMAFFRYLKLTPEDQQALVGLTRGNADPMRFAAAIREDNVRWMILWDLLVLSIASGGYDARDREALRRIAAALGVPWRRITSAEDRLTDELRRELRGDTSGAQPSSGRWWKIAAATIAGGVVLAATGGLAAPAIGGAIGTFFMELSGAAAVGAGLAALGGGAVAAGGFGMVGGTVAVAAALGLAGGGLAGYKMHRRTGGLEEFAFDHIDGRGMHTYIAVSGWLSQSADFTAKWGALPAIAQHGDHYALRWESKHLRALGNALGSLAGAMAFKAFVKKHAAKATKFGAGRLLWPAAVVSVFGVIDNPWHIASDRAEKAGIQLAKLLKDHVAGRRPISLIGFSLGSRLIFHALETLAADGGEGIVDHVILMGAAVTADPSRWAALRRVVSGRLVNAFCTSDWTLRYLYRVAQLTADVAGIAPVESPEVENIDVTHIAGGHLAYGESRDELLRFIGLDAPTGAIA